MRVLSRAERGGASLNAAAGRPGSAAGGSALLFAALAMAGTPASGASAAPPADFQAEVRVHDGPTTPGAVFSVRGRVLTATLPRGEDGAPAGIYRARLDDRDPLVVMLTKMPASLAGPPPIPGAPNVQFTVRGPRGERRLLGPLPPSDPWLDQAMGGLSRWETSARKQAVLAVKLETVPGPAAGVGARIARVIVHVKAEGESGGVARLDLGSLRLDGSAGAAEPKAGVSALPAEWSSVARAGAAGTAKSVKAGETVEVNVVVPVPHQGLRHFRAVYSGEARFETSGTPRDLRLDLSSRATLP